MHLMQSRIYQYTSQNSNCLLPKGISDNPFLIAGIQLI